MINIDLSKTLSSAETFREIALQRLSPVPFMPGLGAAVSSDFDLNSGRSRETGIAELKAAAVLVPVIAGANLSVLFTLRTDDLPAHAGQVSFPGGKIEAGETALDAALREAYEEVGLSPDLIEPLGFLEPYQTVTGYLITPVVGLITPAAVFEIAPREVAAVFQVPLRIVLDERELAIESREWQGITRRFYAMRYGEHHIWGATAGIIAALQRTWLRTLTPS